MATLAAFNSKVEQAVSARDGKALSVLLRMSSADCASAALEYIGEGGDCPSPMKGPWAALPAFVEHRFLAGAALNVNSWARAYVHLNAAVLEYVNNILSKDDSWSIPLLHALCSDLRVVAEEADVELTRAGYKPGKVEDVERTLKKAFAVTNGDRTNEGEKSKRIGTLEVINQLLRVYFKINQLRLCQHLIRTVDAPGFIDFETSFPVEHRVTYKYFVGRLHLFEDRYDQAVECLTYAAENLHASRELHIRFVLMYLIPARILCGTLPAENMLIRYNMHWFRDITKALKSGNLGLFDTAVAEHELFFIRRGLFLVIEKMRPIVYRSLCRHVYRARAAMGKPDPHKLNLDDFRHALSVCGSKTSRNEVECIMANLIYNGLIKGYISHQVGFLVLSTKTPFPPIKPAHTKL